MFMNLIFHLNLNQRKKILKKKFKCNKLEEFMDFMNFTI